MKRKLPSTRGEATSTLLNAIHNISQKNAGKPVRAKAVLDYICPDKDSPERSRATQTFYRLKQAAEPYVQTAGHGKWQLTPKGLDWAQSRASLAPKPTSPSPISPAPTPVQLDSLMGQIEKGKAQIAELKGQYAKRVQLLQEKQDKLTQMEQAKLASAARVELLRQSQEISEVKKAIRDIDLEIRKTDAEISNIETSASVEVEVEVEAGERERPGEDDQESSEEDEEPARPARCERSAHRAEANETKVWLERHLKPGADGEESKLYADLKAAVARKLSLSAATDRVEDHVQHFLTNMMSRNTIGKMKAQGKKIRYSQLCSWAVRSGYNDIRKDGKEPVCRAMYGSTTETERKRGGLWFGEKVDTDLAKKLVPQGKTAEGSSGSLTIMGNEVLIEDEGVPMDRNQSARDSWVRIESLLFQHKPEHAEAYVRVLGMAVEGYTLKEIAAVERVTKSKASLILRDAKKTLWTHHQEFLCA